MPEDAMRVVLLSHTPDPLALVYAAYRQCYHAGCVADSWADIVGGGQGAQARFVAETVRSGHVSPLEHVSFSFAVSGVSRSLTHQLVRHRIASYSQQSQRYVDGSHFDYALPPAIASNPEAKARFCACMDAAGAAYREIKALLEADGRRGSAANEDARFVLPQAATSRIVLTMNCRALLHFFEQRCCARAQWEIRGLASAMLARCREILPAVFDVAGPVCERLKQCPEGEKFTCGRYPVAATGTP